MDTSKKREISNLSTELEKLINEEGLIRKALAYVRLCQQKNKIEGLEIQSKIRELSSKINKPGTNNSIKNKSTTLKENNDLSDFDDPSIVNRTKLNLDVQRIMDFSEEEESEESD